MSSYCSWPIHLDVSISNLLISHNYDSVYIYNHIRNPYSHSLYPMMSLNSYSNQI